MDFVVSCVYFTCNGHSVTCCFLWQGAFYAQVATGNVYNLNPLVFQKLTFRFPTFPVSVTVTDVSVGSFYSPIHFIVFAWVLFDCITSQCLNITSNGTLLPCYGRTWKICHKNDSDINFKGCLRVSGKVGEKNVFSVIFPASSQTVPLPLSWFESHPRWPPVAQYAIVGLACEQSSYYHDHTLLEMRRERELLRKTIQTGSSRSVRDSCDRRNM